MIAELLKYTIYRLHSFVEAKPFFFLLYSLRMRYQNKIAAIRELILLWVNGALNRLNLQHFCKAWSKPAGYVCSVQGEEEKLVFALSSPVDRPRVCGQHPSDGGGGLVGTTQKPEPRTFTIRGTWNPWKVWIIDYISCFIIWKTFWKPFPSCGTLQFSRLCCWSSEPDLSWGFFALGWSPFTP